MQTIKTLSWMLLAIFIMACNPGNPAATQSKTTPSLAKGHDTTDHENGYHKILALNNGVKWAGDESTRIHAVNLIAIADKFSAGPEANLSTYRTFADNLQGELNQLVKNCRMNGAEHDALHLWLEPIMLGVKELKEVSTTGAGKVAAQKLNEDVKKFNQYFN